MLDASSAAAFAPPPLIGIHEPSGRRGAGVAPEFRLRGFGHSKANTSASTTGIAELPLNITGELSASLIDKARDFARLQKRIQFLRIEAEIDGVPFSDASLADFHAFMSDAGPRRRPFVFLDDNGNLRALWKNDQKEQIGLQFLGDGIVQFVIFKARRGHSRVARVAGVDTKENAIALIRATGADELLFG